MRLAIDTGGTFTDCVYVENGVLKIRKEFSTPQEPSTAVLQSVQAVCQGSVPLLRHGTTVGTNAVLERTGARVAFVTTAGFEDTISIGRQARLNLYDWFATPPAGIVHRDLCFGVPERTSSEGVILRRPTIAELDELTERVRLSEADSIAISLLFSFANSENETLVAKALARLSRPLSISHVILPEFREYERASTVALNAYLAPVVSVYLKNIESELNPAAQFSVMQSSGGLVTARFAADQPVRTILSGPAGGAMGAYLAARRAGIKKIIGFDMGGTSTDVTLIDVEEGGPRITNEAILSGIPISVPMLDIHTVGAGGGSIARFDSAGLLHVGPQSAGADPGPICYGRGTQPTVSDANLILGRLDPDRFLGGNVHLDRERTRLHFEQSRASIGSIEEFAAGIVRLAESAMERAIRVISVERGYDLGEFTLVAFGGAGPLHACVLAKSLRIPRVLVPELPGALSALGILLSDSVRDYSKTVMLDAKADLEPFFRELEAIGLAECETPEPVITRSVDVRYAGQGYELNIGAGETLLDDFHQAHRKRYGYADQEKAAVIVNVRIRVTTPVEPLEFAPSTVRPGDGAQAIVETRQVIFDGDYAQTAIYDRDLLRAGDKVQGPAIVVEYSATTVVPPDCVLSMDAYRNLVIEVA